MKTILSLAMILGLVSCASNNKTGDQHTDAVIAHMGKGEQIIGKDWEEKFNKDGFINGEYVAIGFAKSNDFYNNDIPMKLRAEAVATSKLLNSAPTDFKRIVVRTINSANNDEGNVQESQVRITEVKALTGMKSDFTDTQCVKKATPTQDLKYSFVQECRVIVRVSASDLMKAYDFTLDRKYSIKQKNQIQEMLLEEISKPAVSERLPAQVPVSTQAQ